MAAASSPRAKMNGRKDPPPSNVADFTLEEELAAYENMLLIRRFEEKAGQLFGMGLIGGFCHLYIGQEAVVVGMQMALKAGDGIITGYRDHGHMLACGMDPKGVMAELTGRSGGYSKGKGGSMHMFSREKNFYGGHGIVGAQVPIGTGLAFAHKYQGTKNVSLTYFGDGSANQGTVFEAMNLAVDGTDIQEIRKMLELEIDLSRHHAEAEAKVFEAAGGFAPTIGIIGAVLGLIQVMKNLANIDEVGHGIAVSFVATVYGVGVANLFFLPAAAKIKSLMEAEDTPDLSLRVAVRPGGCSGFSYEMFFDSDITEEDEQAVYGDAVKVVVDPASAQLLLGATLDYKDGLDQSGFAITNPNATRTCGCGQSFS